MKLTDALKETADKLDREGIGANVATLLRDARKTIERYQRVSKKVGETSVRWMTRALAAEAALRARPAFIDMECGDGW